MRFDRIVSLMPLLAMVAVQIGLSGMNLVSKVAMEAGMSPFVLVVYRQVVAAMVTAPYAIFLERNRPPLNKDLLMQIFHCSIFGATGHQLLYMVGLKLTTATVSCALGNVLPVFTFILAVVFKTEVVGLRSRAGQAKIGGIGVCIVGAMLLSVFHGPVVPIGLSTASWNVDGTDTAATLLYGPDTALGSFLVLLSNASWAFWFILQGRLCESFNAPYTITSLMCFMSAIQCVIPAAIIDGRRSEWALVDQPLRLLATFYSGMVGSALAFSIMIWTIKMKGPFYVSLFSPLLLVFVAFFGWAFIRDKIYTGTIIGSIIIVLGLYMVLWGKKKEDEEDTEDEACK